MISKEKAFLLSTPAPQTKNNTNYFRTIFLSLTFIYPNTGNFSLRVDIDVDFNRYRSFLRHFISVPAPYEDDHLLDHNLCHLVGGFVRHPSLRHLCRHQSTRQPNLLRRKLVDIDISSLIDTFQFDFNSSFIFIGQNEKDLRFGQTNLRSRHFCHAICRPFYHHGFRLYQGKRLQHSALPSPIHL